MIGHPASRDVAQTALAEGNLVVVFPGGDRVPPDHSPGFRRLEVAAGKDNDKVAFGQRSLRHVTTCRAGTDGLEQPAESQRPCKLVSQQDDRPPGR